MRNIEVKLQLWVNYFSTWVEVFFCKIRSLNFHTNWKLVSFVNREMLHTCLWTFASVIFCAQSVAQDTTLQKRGIEQFLAPSCAQIASQAERFPSYRISKATQYFTPLFPPGEDGKLRDVDRQACLKMEGACLVGEYLYNYPETNGIKIKDIYFKFGKGNAISKYNKLNALDPCRTVAADQDARLYPLGTVIYIPDMRDRVCPQTGKPVDGCFIVGDIGSAIKGRGRFDLFTGECARYSKKTNVCLDSDNNEFRAPKNSKFYVIRRDDPLAAQLRIETDAFIKKNWR